jgi:hypothetical protein
VILCAHDDEFLDVSHLLSSFLSSLSIGIFSISCKCYCLGFPNLFLNLKLSNCVKAILGCLNRPTACPLLAHGPATWRRP